MVFDCTFDPSSPDGSVSCVSPAMIGSGVGGDEVGVGTFVTVTGGTEGVGVAATVGSGVGVGLGVGIIVGVVLGIGVGSGVGVTVGTGVCKGSVDAVTGSPLIITENVSSVPVAESLYVPAGALPRYTLMVPSGSGVDVRALPSGVVTVSDVTSVPI